METPTEIMNALKLASLFIVDHSKEANSKTAREHQSQKGSSLCRVQEP